MPFHTEQHEYAIQHVRDNRTEEAGQQPPYDLVCIGFGTTSLPIAAVLADKDITARVLFVEREKCFTWRPESLLPDKPVGTSFLRDLTTTQNPRSEFTFMNYLHATGQLVDYANNSRLAPSRRLMGHYFRWAANIIQKRDWVQYGQEAVRVTPVEIGRRVAEWAIRTRNTTTGAMTEIQAKRVIIATGAKPHVPAALAAPQLKPLVVHASACADVLAKVTDSKLNIAVVGADQDAAEVFEDLNKRRGQHTATLFVADSALRPEGNALEKDESQPSIFPAELRQRLQSGGGPSSTVSLAVLESLYLARYTQQIAEPDASKWRFQMRTLSEVLDAKQEEGRLRLVVQNPRTGEMSMSDQTFDIVIVATGYNFVVDKQLVAPIISMLDGGAMSVDRDYRVNFRRNTLAQECGMWMLGSLGDAEQRGDDFSHMAERSNCVAKSVLKQMAGDASKPEQRFEQAVL
ncbi:uncharacterized protein RCC_00896 [Ramularia collo-cygni]|uniref:L-ornithine N(5)-monooxygenase [NAD(P)H] n=1 Tax=Ramularia collo-cygni TaxID=112498 RepID=A0A2D3V3W0_9PEZI|nr:uncharacterized protein RCC_00896 [Ramularia collo-cygni]CZT14973.1 uncharacterized protein RCC_00896 [Ramularia collo-cygni]